MFERGKIVLVPFPFTDLSAQKVRPAVIVSQPKHSPDSVCVVFVSSVIPKKASPTDLLLSEKQTAFSKTGLKKTSLIRCHKIATLDHLIVLGEIGALDGKTMIQLNKKLKSVLGL